jgi:hypothetical protein
LQSKKMGKAQAEGFASAVGCTALRTHRFFAWVPQRGGLCPNPGKKPKAEKAFFCLGSA